MNFGSLPLSYAGHRKANIKFVRYGEGPSRNWLHRLPKKKKRKTEHPSAPIHFECTARSRSVRPSVPPSPRPRSSALPPALAARQVKPGKKEEERRPSQRNRRRRLRIERSSLPSSSSKFDPQRGPNSFFFPRLANAAPRENPLLPPREMWDSQRGAKGESRVNLPATEKGGEGKKEIPALRADSLLT